jgi:hypothetical protein
MFWNKKKLSELDQVNTLADTDYLIGVQNVGGVKNSVKIAISDLKQIFQGANPPFVAPVINSFSITGQTNPLNAGDVFGGSKTFTWNISNSNNISAAGIRIIDVTNANTVLATALKTETSKAVTIPNITGAANQTQVYKIEITDTLGTVTSLNYTLTWQAVTIDADLQAYLNVLPSAKSQGFKNAISAFITSTKAGAANWSKVARAYLLAADYRENALYSIKNPASPAMTENGNMLWNEKGFKGNLSSWIDTNFNLRNDSNFLDTDAGITYIVLNDSAGNNACDLGAQQVIAGVGTNNELMAFSRLFSNETAVSINDGTNATIRATNNNSIGIYTILRNNLNVQIIKNGTIIYTGTQSANLRPNLNLFLFGLNTDGVATNLSDRQIMAAFVHKGSINVSEWNASVAALKSNIDLAFPTPSAISPKPINNYLMNLAIPSLVDSSGNGYNASLATTLPSGFTAPTLDGQNNLVFAGNQTIKLNTGINLPLFQNCSAFMVIKCDTAPEATQNLINVGTAYKQGMRIHYDTTTFAGNKFVTVGTDYYYETAADKPLYGKSVPKISSGYQVIGFSLRDTNGTIYHNGVTTSFDPTSPDLPAGSIGGGWLGAFPGGTAGNAYTLPANYKLVAGSKVMIFNYAATPEQMKAKGDEIMRDLQFSMIHFDGDSIMQGVTLALNADTMANKVVTNLNTTTTLKWAGCNVGIGSRMLNEAAAQNATDHSVFHNASVVSVVLSKATPIGGGVKNPIVNGYGINDIANGRTLAELQADFTSIVNLRNSQGFDRLFQLTVTGDALTAPKEQVRLDYNTWLRTQETILNFTLVDITTIAGANTSPIDISLRNDNVHWNANMNTLVANMVIAKIKTYYGL